MTFIHICVRLSSIDRGRVRFIEFYCTAQSNNLIRYTTSGLVYFFPPKYLDYVVHNMKQPMFLKLWDQHVSTFNFSFELIFNGNQLIRTNRNALLNEYLFAECAKIREINNLKLTGFCFE